MASRLIVQSNENPDRDGVVVSVTRQEAGWKYVGFKVWQLRPDQSVSDDTRDEEVGLVVLRGTVTITSPVGTWENVGDRNSVFEGKPYVVYLPPGTPFTLTGVTECEIARAGAKAEHGAQPRLITPAEIAEDVRGEANAARTIRHVLEADSPAEGLFLVEAITPSGNWSSYPPHKHDTDAPPRETYLEETYYHRISPRQGFGFQRIYSQEGDLDEALVVEDGTLVMVPKGYHPAVVAPGYDLYYLNVMAGPVREWRFTDDPAHAWVAKSWRPYGPPRAEER